MRDATWSPPRHEPPVQRWRAAVLLALISINVGIVWMHGDPRAAPAPLPPIRKADLAPSAPSGPMGPPLARVETVVMGAKQSASQALGAHGLDAEDVRGAIASLSDLVNFRRLRPGDQFRVGFDDEGRVDGIDLWRGELDQVRSVRHEDGWRARRIEVPVEAVVAEVGGSVSSSLWAALVETLKEDPKLVQEVVDVFAWEIDFYSEVQRGDHFRLLVEKHFAEGNLVGYGPVMAAEFVNQGDTYRAYSFQDEDGNIQYYNAGGESMRKQLLKAPLKYGHVTSGFGNRVHPILGYTRAHLGTDYGVPSGTPVWSVGDGRVVRAGYHGGYGKVVEVRHANGWQSLYAHLSRIGVRTGERVRQKQIIGNVGSTGMSTGPHLHYGLQKSGRFVNPLAQQFDRGAPLRGHALQNFKNQADGLALRLERVALAVAVP
jgi:murein DD-endopeptidase MepM/ murein hydrolase activator NlpD